MFAVVFELLSIIGKRDAVYERGMEVKVMYLISLFIIFTHTHHVYLLFENQISMTKLILVVTIFPPPPTWTTTFGRTHANQPSMCNNCPMVTLLYHTVSKIFT